MQIIRSAATAERAAKALAADERFRAAGAGAPATPVEIARLIRAGIAATPEKESKIITIHYVAPQPALAALIVNAVVKAYVDQLFEMKMSYSRYAIEWMTGKAREEGARLEEAERKLQDFMRSNDILSMESRAAAVPERLSELGLELTKAETRHRELEAVHQRLAAVAADPDAAETSAAVESDPAFAAVKAQLLRAEQHVAELSRKYGRKHPAMIAARQELEALERKRAAEVRRIVLSVQNEMELAAAREEDLRRRLSSGRSEAVAANEKFVRYEELKRAVETNRQFYDTLMARAKEESLTQQLQGVQVWTLEPAAVPEAPDSPRAARTVLIGLLVGLAGAVAMAFFVEYLDHTVRSAEDLELKTGLPVIGVIPPARGRGRGIETAMLHEPRQPAAESYRALRTSILLSTDGGPPKSLLVTSTAPEEGKTATAVNLAVGIARSGYTVLLVDADLRKPRIGAIFDLPNEHGLSTVLAEGEAPVFAEVGIPGLAVLTSGPVPPNPSELLGSKRMDALLRELRAAWDIVVLDSPPFLTVADSLVIARKVDALLLVARAEHSTYNGVRRGVKTLGDIGVRPLGLVLNAYDESRGGAYYYYHQHYYHEPEAAPAGRRRRHRTQTEAT
ncbi:MAG TPA: polysaccharide biosynthesis tyrosine autokinase [Candidatus Methanoperedens sp.]|nr:polysaccharide biosynthesis tyrosine autokinase [Candidatus Methanoperedens sp.]